MTVNRTATRSNRSSSAPRLLATLMLLLFALAGCHTHARTAHLNPIDPNYALPAAETLDYPGPERFWNKAGIVISPARIVAQVGSEVPMFAGICDGKGQLAPHEQIEWMLDNGGVGSFVTVAEPVRPWCLEVVSTKARKVDNMYALTETSPANVILTRGTANLNDDMVMPRGYTWVTVTSPVEGSSYVTAFGPDVYSWDVRQKSARIIWVDADWCFPESACAKVGEPVTLTTAVCRRTTKTPVSDWIVKYTITGGVAAGFAPDNAQSVEIATGEDGRASVEVVPATAADGTVCVNVELIRSECATPGSPERISIATAATQVTWGIPDPPTPPPSVPAPVPPPATPPSTPPPSLPPSTTVPPASPPPAAPAPPQVSLNVTGPTTALLQQDIVFSIEVTNNGGVLLPNLVLTGRFDDGLKHEKAVGEFKARDVGEVKPGETVKFPMNFRVVKPGRHCVTISLTDTNNLGKGFFETKQACVDVPNEQRPPPPPQDALGVDLIGPASTTAGQVTMFSVVVENRADTPANNVRINVEFDPVLERKGVPQTELPFAKKTLTGYVLEVASIAPRAKVTRSFGFAGTAPVPRALVKVRVFDAAGQPYEVDKAIEVLPSPVAAQGPLKVEVGSNTNPVKAGGLVNYVVTITNVSQADEKQVRLTLTLPAEMTRVGEPRFNARGENIDGRTIQFEPILVLRPNESIPCQITLRADRPGQASVRADVTSLNVVAPVNATAVTRIDPP